MGGQEEIGRRCWRRQDIDMKVRLKGVEIIFSSMKCEYDLIEAAHIQNKPFNLFLVALPEYSTF